MTQQQQSEYSPYRGLKKLGALLVTKQQPRQPTDVILHIILETEKVNNS
jgi:hypothetical protein